MEEKFIYIDGKRTRYTVTTEGDIYSYHSGKKRKLTPCINLNSGYCCVNLYLNGKLYRKYIHRLVAEAFIPNPENKPEVNHKNGDKTKNGTWNLEWVTSKENTYHAFKNELRKVSYGENATDAKITEEIARRICTLLEKNELGATEIANQLSVPVSIVNNIKHKKCWLNISNQYNIDKHNKRSRAIRKPSKPQVRISEEEARNICELLENTPLSVKEICERTGVSLCKINSILYGYGWKKLSNEYDFSKRRGG